jgi:hypothetical protein
MLMARNNFSRAPTSSIVVARHAAVSLSLRPWKGLGEELVIKQVLRADCQRSEEIERFDRRHWIAFSVGTKVQNCQRYKRCKMRAAFRFKKPATSFPARA